MRNPTGMKLNPVNTCLLVMDYQPGIISQLQNGDALIAKTAEAIETIRRYGAHVGYVHVAFTPAEYNAIPEANKGFSSIKTSGRDFGADSPATAIDRRIAPKDGDIVVRKTRVGAFSTTDLDEQLRRRGVDTLLVAGISTSGVVLSTIRDAADRDYRLFVVSDTCADPQPGVHEFLVEKVFPRQADVIQTGDISALFAS